jgi:hypothetical protein
VPVPQATAEGGIFEERDDAKEFVMALKVVWRNPLPVIRTQTTCSESERSFLAQCMRSMRGVSQEFEVILREAD